MTSDKSIQCLSCLYVTKELEQKKQVNFYISCPPSSVYSPASILLAETFYQELASRLLEERLFTFFILNSKRKQEATWFQVIRLEILLKIKPKGKQNKFKRVGSSSQKPGMGLFYSQAFLQVCACFCFQTLSRRSLINKVLSMTMLPLWPTSSNMSRLVSS